MSPPPQKKSPNHPIFAHVPHPILLMYRHADSFLFSPCFILILPMIALIIVPLCYTIPVLLSFFSTTGGWSSGSSTADCRV